MEDSRVEQTNEELYESIYVVGIDDGLHESNIYYPCKDLDVKVGSRVYIDNTNRSYEVLDAKFVLPNEIDFLVDLNTQAQKYRYGYIDITDSVIIHNPNRSEEVFTKTISTTSGPLTLEFDKQDQEEMGMYYQLKINSRLDAFSIISLFVMLTFGIIFILFILIEEGSYWFVAGYFAMVIAAILGHILASRKIKLLELRYILYNIESINGVIKDYDERKKSITVEFNKNKYSFSLKFKRNKPKLEKGVKKRFASTEMGSFEMKYDMKNDFEKWAYVKVKAMQLLHRIFFMLCLTGLVISFVAIPLIILFFLLEPLNYIFMIIGIVVFSELGLVIFTKILDNYVSMFDYDYIIYSVARDGGSIIVEEKKKGVIEYELNGEKKMVNMVKFKPKQGKYIGWKKV